MSDPPDEGTHVPLLKPPTPTTPRPRLGNWRAQVGLRALILIVVVAALGFSISSDRRRIADLQARIERVRPMLHELDVSDPTQFAAIELDAPWAESTAWDVYLPPGHRYQLMLATREIDGRRGWPTPQATVPLRAGRHRLTLDEGQAATLTQFSVREGDTRLISVAEPPSWVANMDHWSSQSVGSRAGQMPTKQPLELLRRRYHQPVLAANGSPTGSRRAPADPSPGVLLWIRTISRGEPD